MLMKTRLSKIHRNNAFVISHNISICFLTSFPAPIILVRKKRCNPPKKYRNHSAASEDANSRKTAFKPLALPWKQCYNTTCVTKDWRIVILVVALIVLYFLGKRAQKKQQEQQEKIDAMAQTVSILVIDKGRMKLKEAGFPSIVLESTPKYLRRSKVYVVKAKVGPKIMTFMCDDKVFPLIPVKKEVKATVSGIYITAVRGVRGPLEAPKKKKGFLARAKESAKKAAMENASKSKKK